MNRSKMPILTLSQIVSFVRRRICKSCVWLQDPPCGGYSETPGAWPRCNWYEQSLWGNYCAQSRTNSLDIWNHFLITGFYIVLIGTIFIQLCSHNECPHIQGMYYTFLQYCGLQVEIMVVPSVFFMCTTAWNESEAGRENSWGGGPPMVSCETIPFQQGTRQYFDGEWEGAAPVELCLAFHILIGKKKWLPNLLYSLTKTQFFYGDLQEVDLLILHLSLYLLNYLLVGGGRQKHVRKCKFKLKMIKSLTWLLQNFLFFKFYWILISFYFISVLTCRANISVSSGYNRRNLWLFLKTWP